MPASDIPGGYGSYYGDFALGASLGAIGVVYLGEIPLPLARELVAGGGFDVVGEPLPPEAAGGPEDRPPPDFDTPPDIAFPVNEAPPIQPPAVVQPPLEGEVIPGQPQAPPDPGPPRGVQIEGEYDRFDQTRSRPEIPGTPRLPRGKRVRRIKNVPPRLPPPENPAIPVTERDIERVITRGIGRIVLGPIGSVIGPVLVPQDLGPGDLPFPPIPRVDIPPPEVTFPESQNVRLPEPEPQEFSRPDVPEVVEVTAPSPEPVQAPPIGVGVPANARSRALFPALFGLIAPILRPRYRGRTSPEAGIQPLIDAPPGVDTAAPPLPLDPLTPPDIGEPLPRGDTGDLTTLNPSPIASPSPFGPLQFSTPLQQSTDDDRCRCPKPRKKRKSPSDKVAQIGTYKRRLSTYSLDNLNRGRRAGKGASKLARKFL